ncbi:ATP-binding protein [Streptomyces sp. NPDC093085]|uniref:ATP-binding protein n=1 Tax=Streptomyces sp. NPDC093085 TaxID=3155068 RepID=UPI00343CBFBA
MRRSLRYTAPALLISAAASGLLCFWAVSSDAPAAVRTPLAWGAAAAVVAAVTAVAQLTASREQQREKNSLLNAHIEQLNGDLARAQEEIRRANADARASAEAASRSETNRAAAISACANAAGRMQALATSMLADLREMEHAHSDEDVLGDLLHLDHRTAQAGRLADSLAVLTGARSGRRWAKPIVMESILRGAMGRISGYQRVRLHSTSEVSIAGHAAEGVMHALAELLDNAANFSPPTAEVHVYVEEVPAGIVITVEDSGLVMSDVQLRRAEQAVTVVPDDLSGLSGTRLGLSVVGRLARKHGLTVSFRPSARGGTGALLMLPQDLLSQARGMSLAGQDQAPLLTGGPMGTGPGGSTSPDAAEGLAGTPMSSRLRRRTAAPAPGPHPAAAHTAAVSHAPVPEPAPDLAPAPATPAPAIPAPVARASRGAERGAGDRGADRGADLPPAAPKRVRRHAPPAPAPSGPSSAPPARPAPTGQHRGLPDEEEPPELGESGLPKRRRGRTLAASMRRTGEANSPARSTPIPPADPAVQAARFSSFRKAVRDNPHTPATTMHPDPEGDSR